MNRHKARILHSFRHEATGLAIDDSENPSVLHHDSMSLNIVMCKNELGFTPTLLSKFRDTIILFHASYWRLDT